MSDEDQNLDPELAPSRIPGETSSVNKLTVALTATVCLAITATVWACSVPVFRYALERWPADPYEVLVFHRGPLSPEQQEIVSLLSSEGQAGKIHANVNLTAVDLDADPDPQLVSIWQAQESETLPWLVVKYPLPTRIPVDMFAGPLTTESVKSLLDSPVRREVARRLLTGDTAVLVLLESGDSTKDAAAFELVEPKAEQLAMTLKLPEIAPEDLDEVSVDPLALKLDFSTIRVSRDDPAEKMFVEMLLGTEEDLRDLDEPMAFPVFGRGRVLYALIGGGITDENVQQAGVDLTGPCTCTVKDQNPGVDLVMAVDWDGLVEQEVEIDKALPPLAGLGSFAAESETSVTAETAKSTDEHQPVLTAAVSADTTEDNVAEQAPADDASAQSPPPTAGSAQGTLWRNLLLLGGIAVVAVFVGSLMLFRKQG